MGLVKQIATFFLGVGLLLGSILWLWITSDDVDGWQTLLFRSGHQMVYIDDEDGGSRTIAFVLRPHEEERHAVKACVNSFDKDLLQDGTFVQCMAYGSEVDAQMSRHSPELICERGRAIQMPYNTAKNAEIIMNNGEHCGQQPKYLPKYLRGYS